MSAESPYEEHVARILRELGIQTIPAKQPPFREATELVSVGLDLYGRDQKLIAPAAAAWHALREAAECDGIILLLVSAFRSLDYQKKIFQRKLDAGQSMEQILRVNAPPGFSEHHTGRTVDVSTPGCQPLTEEFERTPAFAWLVRRAGDFAFRMTYPRDNKLGVIYEPWHWAFQNSGE